MGVRVPPFALAPAIADSSCTRMSAVAKVRGSRGHHLACGGSGEPAMGSTRPVEASHAHARLATCPGKPPHDVARAFRALRAGARRFHRTGKAELVQGVHVWRASLALPADDVATLHHLLDSGERSRAARFRNDQDRRRFVVARATLRMLLGEYTATAPNRVTLRLLPGGKPTLGRERAAAGPHFNLSHCGDLALFAFADREIGIDVERLAHQSDMGQVAAHFFSPEEVLALRQLVGMERARFFFRTWVRKEAYVKATGAGFALDPAMVSVASPPAGSVTLQDRDGIRRVDDRFAVHDLADIDDHLAAVAIAGFRGAPTIHYREWDTRTPRA